MGVADVRPLLASRWTDTEPSFDPVTALDEVKRELISKLAGEPWKGGT